MFVCVCAAQSGRRQRWSATRSSRTCWCRAPTARSSGSQLNRLSVSCAIRWQFRAIRECRRRCSACLSRWKRLRRCVCSCCRIRILLSLSIFVVLTKFHAGEMKLQSKRNLLPLPGAVPDFAARVRANGGSLLLFDLGASTYHGWGRKTGILLSYETILF